MQLFPIYQMSLFGVADAGVPNRERIVLRPTQQTNLAEYVVCLGWRTPDGTTIPLADYMYWFGDRIVEPPSWILLYTCPGVFTESKLPTTGETTFSFHWKRQYTLFNSADVCPILFHIDSVAIGAEIPRIGFGGTNALHNSSQPKKLLDETAN